MKHKLQHFFGMRKVKSLIALAICFVIWQLIRLFLPQLEAHPIYAYFYTVLEMRNSIETEKRTSLERIKTNVIGFSVAFVAVAVRGFVCTLPHLAAYALWIEFAIILVGVLLALNIADWAKCKTLGAIAAMTFIICFWHTEDSPYLYAFLRFLQTLMGVGVAFGVNTVICRPENEKPQA